MSEIDDKTRQTCPGCGKPVDPLRAPAVSVVAGKIVHFCSSACRTEHLKRSQKNISSQSINVKTESKPSRQSKQISHEEVGGAEVESQIKNDLLQPKYRSPRIKAQLIHTAVLAAFVPIVFLLHRFLGTSVSVAFVAAAVVAHTLMILFREGGITAAKIAQAAHTPLSSVALLCTIGLGIEPRIALTSAAALPLIDSAGKLVELLGRMRSGVLGIVEGLAPTLILPSWKNNSVLAARIKRASLVLDVAYIPIAAIIGIAVFLIQSLHTGQAVLSFAIALLILSPRMLRMVSGDAHLFAAYFAAQKGAFFRDANIIDQLANTRMLVFMPENTVLEDKIKITDWKIIEPKDTRRILVALASSENKASGRIASKILEFVKQQGAEPGPIEDFKYISGRGVIGNTPTCTIVCGARPLLLDEGISTARLEEHARSIEATGRSAIFVACDGKLEAVFGVERAPVDCAFEVNLRLKSLGADPVMISSMEADAAVALGARMGIDNVKFETAEDHVNEILQQIRDTGEGVILVGNGAVFEENIDLCNASIAIGNIEQTQAGVAAHDMNISAAPWLIELSRKAVRSTRINMIAAIASLMIGLGLSVSWFTPGAVIFAGLLQAGVSVLCTVNAPYPCLAKITTLAKRIPSKLRSLNH